MAAYNDFVTQNASDKKANVDAPARCNGTGVKKLLFSFEKSATDIHDSIFRVGRISPYAIIMSVKLSNDAISGMSDLDVGFYKPASLDGSAIDADCLLDGYDISGGKALTELYAPAIADVGKEAYLIAGVTAANAKKYGSFDIALTANASSIAEGTISGIVEYVE